MKSICKVHAPPCKLEMHIICSEVISLMEFMKKCSINESNRSYNSNTFNVYEYILHFDINIVTYIF
jgi:hypothetical protein